MMELIWNNPWFLTAVLSPGEPPQRCPITGFPCAFQLRSLSSSMHARSVDQ